jgi:hypothetical protein
MPYHPDSTTRALFISQHIHTPVDLSEVLCSICRQRCTGHTHEVVQISGHPQCQCVFGRSCLFQWLRSGNAASNTCPSCRAVLFNPTGEDQEDSDLSSDPGTDSEDEDGLPVLPSRGRARARQAHSHRSRRATAPSPSPSRSSSSSEDEFHTPPQHTYNLRSRRRSPSPSTASSRTLSAHSGSNASAIDTLVDDVWAGTWDLVTESWELTEPDAAKSRSITRAQLIMLVLDVNPFDEDLANAVVEHLLIRARKMVHKHRKNGVFNIHSELRTEREDIRLAVGYGV